MGFIRLTYIHFHTGISIRDCNILLFIPYRGLYAGQASNLAKKKYNREKYGRILRQSIRKFLYKNTDIG